MDNHITVVDRGRGPQLSTSRITVQDLVPYFQEGASQQEILYVFPSLILDEVVVLERYYREHQREMDEQDQRIRERRASRENTPEVEEELRRARRERLAQALEMIRQSQRERNGDRPAR